MRSLEDNSVNGSGIGRRISRTQTVAEIVEVSAPHQLALLRMLAVSEIYGLDPIPLISSMAEELPTVYRNRLKLFEEQLLLGGDVVDAIGEVPRLVPPSVELAIRLARENGTLSELYNAVLQKHFGTGGNDNESGVWAKLIHLAALVFAVIVVLSFIMISIVPEFRSMLEEFEIESPSALELLIVVADTAVKFWFVGALFLLALIPFAIVGFRRYLRSWNRYVWRQNTIKPTTVRKRSLALVLQAGLSIPAGIKVIKQNKNWRRITGKLGKAQDRINNGHEAWDSLAIANVITRRDVESMKLSASGETQAWLLRWSANTKQARQRARSGFLVRVLMAMVYITVGLIVVLAASAVFLTLITIMTDL